ncbi:hypothetical protein [Pseudomonas monteilii]|uniref:hypothetical protein n=1 Tax=Pseudomonas monteilii TaxID=76759 RepID=UPI00048C31FC|nr:hypothetical protein [Pseudomonas monteilii]
MAAHKEEIAQLTGSLRFNVESAGFKRFENMMKNASKTLAAFARQYEALSKQMAKTLKLKIDTTAADKAKQKLDAATKRQAHAEAALSNQQRKTFTAELQQQKLKYAGTKAQHQLNNAALQSQKDAAVVAAKAAASHAKAQGTTKAQLASQNALTASLTRQAKLEAILANTRAATQKASQQHLATQTKLQRIQQQMNHAQQQAHYRAQQQQAKMAAAQQTAQNKAQNATQSAARFQWAQQRHAAWQARQNAPTPSSGMFGSGIGNVLAVGGAIGGIGAAVALLSTAVSKLGERIDQRKESVQGAEAFNGMFTAISRDPKVQAMWRDTFIKSQLDNGGTVDTDSAKDFRNFVMAQLAYNKTPDQITKGYNLRQQAFAIGGATRDDAKELNKQLGQMSSDGTGSKADYDIINDRMPMMAPYLVRAYGEQNNIADRQKALQQFNKDLKGGKGVKYSWYERAMELMVKENQGMLDDRKKTVSFAQNQADAQKFLNDNHINTSAELSSALKDSIQASKEFDNALQPVNESLKNFDQGLIRAKTAILYSLLGKNPDGSVKKDSNTAESGVFSLDAPAINPSAGVQLDNSKEAAAKAAAADPVNKFWNWIFGNDRQDSKSDTPAPGLLGSLPDFKLDTSKLLSNMPDYTALASNLPPLQAAATGFKTMQDQMSSSSVMPTTNQTFNSPITVEGSKFDITINGSATEKDKQEMLDFMKAGLAEQELSIPRVAQKAVLDVFGQARAQQAERQ